MVEAEAILRQRVDLNDKTISSQLQTRALLQLEVERLLGQLKLAQGAAPDHGAAEPVKRKRTLAVESALAADEGLERGSPARWSASPSAGYATPTETGQHPCVFSSGWEPGRAAALATSEMRRRQLSSSDMLCQVDESDGLLDDFVIVGEPVDRSMSYALDYDLHDGPRPVSNYNVRERKHEVYDEDGDDVYRSLPLEFIGAASYASEGAGAIIDTDHVANLGALSLHDVPAQPAAASALPDDSPGSCHDDYAELLGRVEALRAELAGNAALSEAQLNAMLGSVRAWTAALTVS